MAFFLEFLLILFDSIKDRLATADLVKIIFTTAPQFFLILSGSLGFLEFGGIFEPL